MTKNNESKSGLYNWSLTTITDNYSGVVLSYIINDYPVTEQVSRTEFEWLEVSTSGFENAIDFFDYIGLLEITGAQELTNDKTTLELL